MTTTTTKIDVADLYAQGVDLTELLLSAELYHDPAELGRRHQAGPRQHGELPVEALDPPGRHLDVLQSTAGFARGSGGSDPDAHHE